jgi:hypothetical protein
MRLDHILAQTKVKANYAFKQSAFLFTTLRLPYGF